MSMTILTILQIAQALSAYTLVTCIFPAILLHKRLAAYKMSERLIDISLPVIFILFIWYFCSSFFIYHILSHCRLVRLLRFFQLFEEKKNFHIVSRVSSASQLAIHVLRREVGVKTLIVKGWKNFSNQHSDKIKNGWFVICQI